MFRKANLLWAVLVFALPVAAQDMAQIATKPICEPAAFTISAHSAKNCAFVVPEGRVAKLVGHFTATGGPRNTIEVWVLDDDAYVNWENHHAVHALYNSQKVTTGTIEVMLRPGKYHVVFDNLFSIMTPKAIEANMALEFKVPQVGTN